jgi:hypothetical protein
MIKPGRAGIGARDGSSNTRVIIEEHRRALDFLNENAAPNLQFIGVEMQLWRIGDSVPAPLFRIVSSTCKGFSWRPFCRGSARRCGGSGTTPLPPPGFA